ncbi:SDR family oxidoreductase [Paracoccus tegillarcae]|uniref:NAD(P)-dependent oxidoreductase n=1 Tax=Paracoccus tegillarcae TaxID=1529068 RepID=A0A2K9EFJ6_9RHOB|nr:SDR family oxidoreductase [Paracoccus tegillarcae]AUH33713.1 NAD(P)-dependent oxidoreductase [Paracoccus tegillarcae]
MTAPRRLLITGGSRGIGRAAALLAGAQGWSVAVNYRKDQAAADQVVDQITSQGGNATALQADIGEADQVADLFDRAEAALGGLDAVVVNAGIVAPVMKLAEMQDERLQRMVQVNLLGALYCAREAARRLPRPKDQPPASLVLLSSAAARLGSPGEFVDYAATKGAIDTLTLGLARELGPDNIRVNAIRPGLIDTDMQADSGIADRAFRLAGNIPMGRPGTADEVAEAVIWLAGEASRYVSGSILDVSGGR